ncbi:segment polarity protein dishevelled homolog DVL-2 isoform X1 [Tachysurus fulvidraco]|uniref:segment polarity protein dishevelled homolog DVL-2 isoform X1 n=1 Tax=Tachysurus fulvidraco TaxID=1234273 RepID=UPI000F4DB0A7|nr:segment polarity protein dishevelled homolog DVL-2 isoform X1 [Tachysurus fulvidraco]XP_047673889.1 segment polarity protein dishevelled homolog DVL-2 isoform X1 [Tachysurus fulvidraco]
MAETKIIYHIDEEETPYLVKIPIAAEKITLLDFKQVLNKPNYKFFFKSMDQDFGVVKEEISDDNAKLPCFNGRVVSWLVSSDVPAAEPAPPPVEVRAQPSPPPPPLPPPPAERTGGIGDSRPPSFHPNAAGSVETLDEQTETESVVSFRRERPRHRESMEHGPRINGQSRMERHLAGYESATTVMSSELETTSFCDSDDDDTMSRFSSSTEQSTASRLLKRHRRRRKQRPPRLERVLCTFIIRPECFLFCFLTIFFTFLQASSFSSVTDSTMSLNIITVTLNMEKYNFLGISIVGQSNERGDGGIYIGSIMKGGAVAADGRIEPGDMLLQVNDINFENMSNDDAVRVLREIVHKPGPITLTVAKCWDPSPQGYFTLPRNEPIRPIDPAAWVTHSVAMTGAYPPYPGSTITSSSSVTETERFDEFNLSLHSDMASVAKAMASPESGLEVRDRMWLKITIPNAFLGSDVVEWLYHHIEGFQDRREARKYASNLLKAGFIRHTVNKITFSEQCYYIFGDFSDCENYMANLSLNDNDGSSGASDQDTLAPLPLPGATPWPLLHSFPYQYPHPYNSQPPPYHELSSYSYAPGSTGSQHSEGSRSSGSTRSEGERRRGSKSGSTVAGSTRDDKSPNGGGADSRSGSGSESEYSVRSLRRDHGSATPSEHSHASQRSHHRAPPPHLAPYPPGIPIPYNPMMVMMVPQHPHPHPALGAPHPQTAGTQLHPGLPPPINPGGPPGAPPTRDLASVPPELTASRQSFHLAMGNPSEFFVDVM